MHPFWKSDVLIHGIMAVSIVGDFADITVVLYGMKDKVTDITILGSELVGKYTFRSLFDSFIVV